MAASRVTYQDILSSQGSGVVEVVVPLDCREATLYLTFVPDRVFSNPRPSINGVDASKFITHANQEGGSSGFMCNCRVDFPAIFDQNGCPVNYNDQLIITGVDGVIDLNAVTGATALIKRVYFDPVIPDPNQPRQR